jgi:hypothetical protein
MEHHAQHHEHHHKEHEHEKQQEKEYERKEGAKSYWPFHPKWLGVLGIVLTVLVLLVWTFLL